MEWVDPIREYCHLPETEDEASEELPDFYEDHLNSTVQQIDEGNEENLEISIQDLVHGDELENMSQTSEEISLDSMETAFSSDDPMLAELEEPSCQKILESDMIRISISDG
ncbi:Oidioi.mRNA.OKI2018_I69.chr1.g2693.t1.cds [Oikopleura dioica]|uniref:Oidioi.mRNA.OKI2018_I69.chr1.g2693.t1.cds n=1 Tax=Oikopleura dioica TaxID=34765 RepID=A0ABN7SXA2_OIKDI|nr:Oidioi.mRNA.OKI2018_I69.chr1.g2693.t1.cds [Oikopleura dioica]